MILHDQLTAEIAAGQNPDTLIRLNSEMRLGLVPPRQEQSEHVAVDAEQWLAEQGGGLFIAEVKPVDFRRGGTR